MDAPARTSQDLTIGLRNLLSDAEPSTYVSLEAQLRRAVYERLVQQVDEERDPRRRRRSSGTA